MKENKATEQEAGIVLPDDASKVDQVQAADRLLGFDADGNPTAPTAEQLKEFVAEGLVDTEAMNTALAGKADKNGSITEPFKAAHLFLDNNTVKGVVGKDYSEVLADDDVFLINWDDEKKGAVALSSAGDPYFLRMGEWIKRTLWHAGNFDPASKANAPATLQNADLNTLTSNGLYVADGAISNAPVSTANCRVLVIATSPYRVTQITQVYDADRLFFRRRVDEQWQPWREVYHSGNLAPATVSAAGLMSAEDRIKLNSVASALSLPVVTEDTPTTLEETDEDTAPVMAVTPQACVRAQRAAQYQMQTDELLYDALEAFARNHPEYSEFAAWLEAKDRIRQEFPKPGATEVADGPETDGEPQTGGTEPAAEQNQKGGGK